MIDIDKLNIKTTLVGLTTKKDWKCYMWNVVFDIPGKPLYQTTYYTGILANHKAK